MANGFKTGGRQKGTPNKITASVREKFEEVFTKLQEEAAEGDPPNRANLLEWAKTNPTEFYKLAAKLIPANVEVTGQVDIAARILSGLGRIDGE